MLLTPTISCSAIAPPTADVRGGWFLFIGLCDTWFMQYHSCSGRNRIFCFNASIQRREGSRFKTSVPLPHRCAASFRAEMASAFPLVCHFILFPLCTPRAMLFCNTLAVSHASHRSEPPPSPPLPPPPGCLMHRSLLGKPCVRVGFFCCGLPLWQCAWICVHGKKYNLRLD